MTIEEVFNKYGEPIYVGSKHLVWKDTERNRAVKATRPGYLAGGISLVTSQSWQEPADPSSPHPSIEEMTEYLQSFGFSQVSLTDWQRPDGIVARDVKARDFMKTKDGLVPIDLFLEDPNSQD